MKQSGVTLLELMAILAISAILLVMGIPGFASLATNELVSSLHLTRSEAIKRGSRAVMCPSTTGNSCAGSGGWHHGWVEWMAARP